MQVNNGQKNDALLRVRNLTKSFGRNLVWSNVSFELRPGEVLGLVGPNGAGKTTLLLTLMGFLRFDCGNVRANDQQVEGGRTPRGVGFIPDRPVFYDWQTPVQHLATSSSFTGQNARASEIQGALTAVGLQNERLKPIRNFSRGMMQRLAWAQMMVTKPKVLLLDEPTSALDPLGVAALRDFVSGARDSGAGILFSSHTLSEVERICDRVLFLVRGKLSEMDLTKRNTCTRIRMRLHPASSRDLGCLQAVATEVSITGDTVLFTLDGERSLNDIVRVLSESGLEATSLEDLSNSVEVALRNKLEEQ